LLHPLTFLSVQRGCTPINQYNMPRYRTDPALKKLKGTLRPSRELTAPPEFKPYSDISQIEIPADLPEYAQQVYYSTAEGLIPYQVITPLDLQSLRSYSYQCWLIHEAEKSIQEQGAVIDMTSTRGHTNKVKNPWIAVLHESTTLANRLGSAFGLAPSHRQKLNMEIKKKPGKLAQLMNGKGNPFEGMPRGPEDLDEYMEAAWNSF
jgi:P27 family predicted phage terminase small subunit